MSSAAFLAPGLPSSSSSSTFTSRTALTLSTRSLPRLHRARPRTRPLVTMSSQKMLHAVYRVGDLAATRRFLSALGMHVLRERDVPSEKYTNVFFGYGPEQHGEHFSLELTYNYGVQSYDLGSGFGHFGVAVSDVAAAADRVRHAGFKVTREPAPVKGGTMVVAFVQDPTGYKFELIERERRDPLCRVMLRVRDLDASIKFYEMMGMKLLRREDNEEGKYTLAFLGYAAEEESTVLELTYNWGDHEYEAGDGYAQIAVSTPDVFKIGRQLEEGGVKLARQPGEVPGIGTKICAVRDPDGWKTVLVDEEDFEKEFES